VDVGLYGKLPSHGDFLRRRTSDAFVAAWDAWLQQAIAESRAALGDRWLDLYLTSPVWRFAAAPGACGPAPVVGVMAPSVDRVGRYFPLTIVADVPAHVTPMAAASMADRFFDRAEQLVVGTAEADLVDFEEFDRQVALLGDDLLPLRLPAPVVLQEGAGRLVAAADGRCQVPIGSTAALPSVLDQLLAACLSVTYAPLVAWWTEGSAAVEPCCVLSRGLPLPRAFAAMLDGAWSAHQWTSLPAQVEAVSGTAIGAPEPAPLRLRSAAISDVGDARSINQDSFLEFGESGLWVVADGMGGHSHGETASRMVCDALASFMQVGTFEETIEAACERLRAVNGQLFRSAALSTPGDRCGSTVVALLVRGSRCALLWAGDSRAYRLRAGRLEQMTRDHTAAAAGVVGASAHAIARAVGAQETLDVEVCSDRILPGDRYLLCSDGLTGPVPAEQIRQCLESPDIGAAVQALLEATLDAGAPDNVTALVVEASGADA